MRPNHPSLWLEAHGQRLRLVPQLGGGVANWQCVVNGHVHELWRPWSNADDPVSLASFPMLPWCNRISQGGFEYDGRHYVIEPNRTGEPYPIHGDGWLQPWQAILHSPDSASLTLQSRRFQGTPYEYDAEQRFKLVDGGLEQTLSVTHVGANPLPYGLGLHPWFQRFTPARLTAGVKGVWHRLASALPDWHTAEIPPDWNLQVAQSMYGSLIDNAFTGWDGRACVNWPVESCSVSLHALPLECPSGPREIGYCHIYRPETGNAFCVEPVTHPVDAFHLIGSPGLVKLGYGETMHMRVRWQVHLRG